MRGKHAHLHTSAQRASVERHLSGFTGAKKRACKKVSRRRVHLSIRGSKIREEGIPSATHPGDAKVNSRRRINSISKHSARGGSISFTVLRFIPDSPETRDRNRFKESHVSALRVPKKLRCHRARMTDATRKVRYKFLRDVTRARVSCDLSSVHRKSSLLFHFSAREKRRKDGERIFEVA